MNLAVTMTANFGENEPLQKMQSLIDMRMRVLGETPKKSVTAMAINILKSIRAKTKEAKKKKGEIDLEPTNFKASTYRVGKKLIPCIRFGKSRYFPPKNQHIVWTDDCKTIKMYNLQVYWYNVLYSKTGQKYLIVAPSMQSAKRKADQILKRRIDNYKGLARRAITLLMVKGNLASDNNKQISERAETVATKETDVVIREKGQGVESSYSIMLSDKLNYAKDALKGGEQTLNICVNNAINKTVGYIKSKIKNTDLFTKSALEFRLNELKA